MRTFVHLFVVLLLIACGSKPDSITSVADLKRLSDEFRIELQAAGVASACTETGLKEIETFVESKPESEQKQHIVKVGAYLGECIIESYGGKWIEHEQGLWGIELSENN